MTALPAILYIAAVVYAIGESAKRWMTVLWILVSLIAVVAGLYLLSLIWPFGEGIFAYMALPLGFLISGFVGINHMRAHRRTPKPA